MCKLSKTSCFPGQYQKLILSIAKENAMSVVPRRFSLLCHGYRIHHSCHHISLVEMNIEMGNGWVKIWDKLDTVKLYMMY